MKKNILAKVLVVSAVLLLVSGCKSKPVPIKLPTQESTSIEQAWQISSSEAMEILSPSTFAKESNALSGILEDLNRAELKFIYDVAGGSKNTDSDLGKISDYAMQLATSAEKLANTTGIQDGDGYASMQLSKQYLAIAKTAYSLVIEIQNIRKGVKQNSVTILEARSVIAEYGARLWTPGIKELTRVDNAFTSNVNGAAAIEAPQFLPVETAQELNLDLSKNAKPESWLAISNETVEKTLTIPSASSDPVSRTAAQKLMEIVATEGKQFADQEDLDTLTVTLSKGISLSDLQTITDLAQGIERAFPTFTSGLSSTVNSIIQQEIDRQVSLTLMELAGVKAPQVTADVQITVDKPVVNLQIVVTGMGSGRFVDNLYGDAPPLINFNVSWTSDLKKPKFQLQCISVGRPRSETYTVETANGEEVMTLEAMSPTTKIVCNAVGTNSGNKYGSASITLATPDKNDETDVQEPQEDKPQDPPAEPTQPVENEEVTEAPATATTIPEVETEAEPSTPAAAISPVTYIKASFTEKVTAGSANNFLTTADLTANFDQKTITGNISGKSGKSVEFKCYEKGKTVVDYATVGYDFSYTTFANGVLNPATGAFTAEIAPDGKITGELTAPFIKPICTHMNDDPIPGLEPFSGKGTISGVIGREGISSLSTKWTAGKASVGGSWKGVGFTWENF